MNSNKKLIIISNEKASTSKEKIYCDNIDMKSIPEGLGKNYEVLMISRKSNTKRFHQINVEKIKLANNIFTFLLSILKTFKYKEANYLIVSITPYTFFSYLLLFIFRKKIFVYLRSNGYEEYKYILGFIGPFLYHIMFTIVSWKANLISCRSHLLKGKYGKIVAPSQLSKKWFLSHQKPNLNKVKLLYVGRIKVEKGIFSLLEIFQNLKMDVNLSIVGVGKNDSENKVNQKNVNVIDFENKNDSIIKVYDSHNIFILPSFTEAHPKVVDESLARMRPVIIFEEISHIIQNRYGIFISKRNVKSLLEVISFILSNYSNIQDKMKKNKLPTKQKFISQMVQILN